MDYLVSQPLLSSLLLASFGNAAPVNSSAPALNATTCSWDSPKDFIQHVQDLHLNVTETVQRCPNACEILFGVGNPDISGKGVMISYILQIGITCIFGPLLPVFVFAVQHLLLTNLQTTVRFLRKLQSSANEINSFFCITVMISGIVRYKETPLILEIIFIQDLINMQWYIMITLLLSKVYDVIFNKIPPKVSHTLYQFVLMFAQIATSSSVAIPHNAYESYHEVSKACHILRAYKDVSYYFAITSSNTWKWFGIGFGAAIGGLLLLGLLIPLLAKIGRWLGPLWNIPIFKWTKKNFHRIFAVLMAMLYVYLLISCVIRLGSTRLLLRNRDSAYQDDEWGYGQTTAVLIWLPLLRPAIKEGWRLWGPRSTEGETQATNAQPAQDVPAANANEPLPPYSPSAISPQNGGLSTSLETSQNSAVARNTPQVPVGGQSELLPNPSENFTTGVESPSSESHGERLHLETLSTANNRAATWNTTAAPSGVGLRRTYT